MSRAGGVYLDATFGAGGYSRLMLEAADCRVIGIDRDRSAIANGAGLVDSMNGRLTLVEGRFSELAEIAESRKRRAARRHRDGYRRFVDAAR